MRYAFVVDTDSYAGNFERPLVAYMTGQIGECQVGEEEANEFLQEEGEDVQEFFDSIVDQVPDDNGCYRPAAIFATPGWFNTGMGNEHRDGTPDDEVLAAYKKSSIDYEIRYREMFKAYLDELISAVLSIFSIRFRELRFSISTLVSFSEK